MSSRELPPHQTELTVVNWNVGGCRIDLSDTNHEDVSYFADVLRDVTPDLVYLQEVHVFPDGHANQASLLAAAIGLPYVYVHAGSKSHLDGNAQLSMAVLSRHPLSELEYSILPTPALTVDKADGAVWTLFPKGVITGSAQIHGTRIALFCAHAHPFHHFGRDALEPEFASSWEYLDGRLARLADGEVIAGIDLNDERYDRLVPASLARGVRNVFSVPTTPKGVQQDYLMYAGRRIEVKGWDVDPTRADHHVCHATFVFRR